MLAEQAKARAEGRLVGIGVRRMHRGQRSLRHLP